jgi:hypothetical protein
MKLRQIIMNQTLSIFAELQKRMTVTSRWLAVYLMVFEYPQWTFLQLLAQANWTQERDRFF